MSLYGNNKNNFSSELLGTGIFGLKNKLYVPTYIAIAVSLVIFYNLFQIAEIFIHFSFSELFKYISILSTYALKLLATILITWFCFSRTNWQLAVVIFMNLLVTLGWISAFEVMSTYDNTMVWDKYEFFNYIGSIQFTPHFIGSYFLKDVSHYTVKLYIVATEVLSIALLILLIFIKRNFLKKINFNKQ